MAVYGIAIRRRDEDIALLDAPSASVSVLVSSEGRASRFPPSLASEMARHALARGFRRRTRRRSVAGADQVHAPLGIFVALSAIFRERDALLNFAETAIDPSQCPEGDVAGFIDEHLRALLALGPLTYGIDGADLVVASEHFGLMPRTGAEDVSF